MTNLDIPIALTLIVGGLMAYIVWVFVRAADRTSRRLCHALRAEDAHPAECVSCRRRITRGTS